MRLNDSYAVVRAQILLMQLLPSIYIIFSLLIQEEQQRSAGILIPSTDLVALTATGNTSPTMAISFNQNHKKKRLTCSYYAIKGHLADRCYMKHGYPLG